MRWVGALLTQPGLADGKPCPCRPISEQALGERLFLSPRSGLTLWGQAWLGVGVITQVWRLSSDSPVMKGQQLRVQEQKKWPGSLPEYHPQSTSGGRGTDDDKKKASLGEHSCPGIITDAALRGQCPLCIQGLALVAAPVA